MRCRDSGSARSVRQLDVGVMQLFRIAVAPHVAGDEQVLSRANSVAEVRDPVEPLERHGRAAVAQHHLEHAPAIAQLRQVRADDAAGEAGGATDFELADRTQVAPVLVGPRQKEQQVFDSVDLLARQRSRDLGTDPRHALGGLAQRPGRVVQLQQRSERAAYLLDQGRVRLAVGELLRRQFEAAARLGGNAQFARALQGGAQRAGQIAHTLPVPGMKPDELERAADRLRRALETRRLRDHHQYKS